MLTYPLFLCLLIYAVAFATAYLLKPKSNVHFITNNYETIDGLRGFLALGVFIHHAAVWEQYLQTGEWKTPPTNLYAQLGETNVSLFFMITSFLFISKLIHQKVNLPFSWKQFFIGRIFRLVPIYYFTLLLLIIVVFYLSNWNLYTNWVDLIKSVANWALFTINAIPGVNKYPDTSIIIARVVWSLPYEWFFYICLPLIGFVLLKNKPHWLTITISLIVAVGFYTVHGISIKHVLSFSGGAIAPFLLKYQVVKFNIKHWLVSAVVVLSVFSIGLFNSAHQLACKVIIALIFTLIACGNDVFGLLKNQSLKLLGNISYSTYLLHGIVLFITFKTILVGNEFQNLSSNTFALVIVILTPIIVVISYLTYIFIEKPFINLGKKMLHNKTRQK